MPFGAFLDAAMSIPRNMQMEEDRNQRQQHDWGAMQHTMNFNAGEAAAGRDFNSAQALISRDWQERMSNTQYQRSAADASAAGLNRILAMRQGGAGTPGGATASGGQASGSASGSGGGPGSAASAFGQSELASGYRAERILKDQQAYNVSADTEQKKQATNLIMEQQNTQKELTNKTRAEAEIASHSAKGKLLEGQIDETRYGEIMRYIDRLFNSVSPLRLGR